MLNHAQQKMELGVTSSRHVEDLLSVLLNTSLCSLKLYSFDLLVGTATQDLDMGIFSPQFLLLRVVEQTCVPKFRVAFQVVATFAFLEVNPQGRGIVCYDSTERLHRECGSGSGGQL